MPRRSRAEIEFNAVPRETGVKPDTSPPEILVTAADRAAFADLISRFPHVAGRRNFRAILGTYVRLMARIRALQGDVDDREYCELVKGLEHIESLLGLPRSARW